MSFARVNLSRLILLLVVLGGLAAGGCASTEPDNMSARPWAAPKSWETGLPGGMTEGR